MRMKWSNYEPLTCCRGSDMQQHDTVPMKTQVKPANTRASLSIQRIQDMLICARRVAGRPGNDARLAKDKIRAMHAAQSEMVADALNLGRDLTDLNRQMVDMLGAWTTIICHTTHAAQHICLNIR